MTRPSLAGIEPLSPLPWTSRVAGTSNGVRIYDGKGSPLPGCFSCGENDAVCEPEDGALIAAAPDPLAAVRDVLALHYAEPYAQGPDHCAECCHRYPCATRPRPRRPPRPDRPRRRPDMTRTITTAAELDALPVGSVVMCDDEHGVAKRVDSDIYDGLDWLVVGNDEYRETHEMTWMLPATVLHDPSAPAPVPSVVPEAAVALRDVIDEALAQVIDERDAAESMADRLAARLAEALGRPDAIGEHSSSNDPWQNALDLPDRTAAPSATRDEVARALCPDVWRIRDDGPFPAGSPPAEAVVRGSRESADALLARYNITPKEDR